VSRTSSSEFHLVQPDMIPSVNLSRGHQVKNADPRFNDDHADIEMPPGYHGQEVLKRCLTAHSIDSPDYVAAKEEMAIVAGKNGLFAVMDEHDLDAVVCVREGCHSLANMVGAPIGESCPVGPIPEL
jgi:hypothetical protein